MCYVLYEPWACNNLCLAGYVAPWSGRFYSLWDTGYAKIHIPIIASVSEHQPTAWTSFFFDLHILICVFPVGLWYVIKDINDSRVFSESIFVVDHVRWIFFFFFPYFFLPFLNFFFTYCYFFWCTYICFYFILCKAQLNNCVDWILWR